jgi:hypothetical protein
MRPTPACTGCGLQVISYWLGSRAKCLRVSQGEGLVRGGKGGGFEDILFKQASETGGKRQGGY